MGSEMCIRDRCVCVCVRTHFLELGLSELTGSVTESSHVLPLLRGEGGDQEEASERRLCFLNLCIKKGTAFICLHSSRALGKEQGRLAT